FVRCERRLDDLVLYLLFRCRYDRDRGSSSGTDVPDIPCLCRFWIAYARSFHRTDHRNDKGVSGRDLQAADHRQLRGKLVKLAKDPLKDCINISKIVFEVEYFRDLVFSKM